MGLCKCPKKKVTNLFCFEHRVNVCEHCLVNNHERCVVQSYLAWLQDSDYDPSCRLCGKPCGDEQCGPCVRLTCYDVFHWECIDRYARTQPANTAPAGYTCPVCNAQLFPAPNQASPVAEALRKRLVQVNWARAGLGLPLISDPDEPNAAPVKPAVKPASQQSAAVHVNSVRPPVEGAVSSKSLDPPPYTPSTTAYTNDRTSVASAPSTPHSVVSMDTTPFARAQNDINPRKLFDSTRGDQSTLLNQSHDHDDDKYKRRPALQWLGRWFSSQPGVRKNDPNAGMKKMLVIVVLGMVTFITVIMVMTRVGRASAERDPFLDPLSNPNIRVEE